MTDPKPATPATDAEVEEFFDLLQSFGCESGRVDGKLMGRCSVCFGPWFDPEGTEPVVHDADCSTVTGPKIKARIAADAEIIKARESAYDHAQEGLKSARKQEAEMRETIKAQAEEIAGMRDALIRLRDCNWVISPPDRMDAVRDIAREALAATEPKG